MISGLRVTWDHTRLPKTDRVTGVWLLTDEDMFSMYEDAINGLCGSDVRYKEYGTPIPDEATGVYKIVTLQFMVKPGGDGFDKILAEPGKNAIVSKETGIRLDAIVKQYVKCELKTLLFRCSSNYGAFPARLLTAEEPFAIRWDSKTQSYSDFDPEQKTWLFSQQSSSGEKLAIVKKAPEPSAEVLVTGSALSIGELAAKQKDGISKLPLYVVLKDHRLVNQGLSYDSSGH